MENLKKFQKEVKKNFKEVESRIFIDENLNRVDKASIVLKKSFENSFGMSFSEFLKNGEIDEIFIADFKKLSDKILYDVFEIYLKDDEMHNPYDFYSLYDKLEMMFESLVVAYNNKTHFEIKKTDFEKIRDFNVYQFQKFSRFLESYEILINTFISKYANLEKNYQSENKSSETKKEILLMSESDLNKIKSFEVVLEKIKKVKNFSDFVKKPWSFKFQNTMFKILDKKIKTKLLENVLEELTKVERYEDAQIVFNVLSEIKK